MGISVLIRRLALLSCLSIVAIGCDSKSVSQPALPRAPVDQTVSTVVDGNTQFAIDLYHQLRPPITENLFFSPYSISTALAMTYAGARGQTASEMAQVLHFDIPNDQLHSGFGSLARDLDATDKNRGYLLRIANRLWCRTGDSLLDEFVTTTRDEYGAEIEQLDFAQETERCRQRINGWVEEKTNQRIKDLLVPGVLEPSTVMVLTNAVYFKGDWGTQFEESNTAPAEFHVTADQAVTVPMMHQTKEFNYAEIDELQVLEMPYRGGDLSMVILLPKTAAELTALEEKLDTATLEHWMSSMRTQSVNVGLPKFKLTLDYRLEQELNSMGMPTAFSDAADFSGITGQPDRSISAVVHKAFVEVNEEGTEAAAATAIVMRESAIESNQFLADRPFVFLIRDTHTGSLLFMGRVANPQ